MRVQITGIGSSEYTDKNTGVLKKNKTLYFTKLDNVENVDGLVTGSEFISGNTDFYKLPYKVGQVLNLFYERQRFGNNERAVLAAVLDEHMKPLS